jgi:ribonuclease III
VNPLSKDFSGLYRAIAYQFNDSELLSTALTHRSFGAKNNERFEFLGDSILNFAIAETLFLKFPNAPEGDLSRLRAALVKGETLAELAGEMNLGAYLRLGEGELKSGGSQRPSILADAVEAIIGAIYLDASIDIAKNTVLTWYAERLQNITLVNSEKDPKTSLQEWLQARKRPLPQYDVIAVEGESHNQQFTVKCEINSKIPPTLGTANSRKMAEKEAASLMLNWLERNARD